MSRFQKKYKEINTPYETAHERDLPSLRLYALNEEQCQCHDRPIFTICIGSHLQFQLMNVLTVHQAHKRAVSSQYWPEIMSKRIYKVGLDLGSPHPTSHIWIRGQDKGLDENSTIQENCFRIDYLRSVVDGRFFPVRGNLNARLVDPRRADNRRVHKPLGIVLNMTRPFTTGAIWLLVVEVEEWGVPALTSWNTSYDESCWTYVICESWLLCCIDREYHIGNEEHDNLTSIFHAGEICECGR